MVAPVGAQHANAVTARIKDFVVPPGTLVFENLSSIFTDPKHFEQPEQFRPERFLSPDLKLFVPNPVLIPFGIGKRSCPGKSLVNMEIFLFMGILIRHFNFSPSDEGIPDPQNCTIGLLRTPFPYKVKLTPRF